MVGGLRLSYDAEVAPFLTEDPMRTMLARASALAFLLAAGWAPSASAQVVGQSPTALEGVSGVDAEVAVTWVPEITEEGGPTEAEYTESFRTAFHEALGEGGVTLSDDAPNYLYCSIALLYDDGGLVSAAQSVEFHEPFGDGGQWAITWMKLQVSTVGLENLDGADDALWCAQQFLADWGAVSAPRAAPGDAPARLRPPS